MYEKACFKTLRNVKGPNPNFESKEKNQNDRKLYVICNLVNHFQWEKYFLVGSLETSIINLCVRYILNNVNNLK